MEKTYQKLIKPELNELIAFCEKSGITQLELEMGDFAVNFTKSGDCATQKANLETEPQEIPSLLLNADRVGVFHFSSPENPITPVKAGETVKQGQKLGFIETLSLYYDIVSPCDGTLKNILVREDEIVEFGKLLLELTPAGN